MQHFSPRPPSPALVPELPIVFVPNATFFRLVTPFSVTSPLCRLCLKSTVTFMLCLDQALALPVFTAVFSKKQSSSDGWGGGKAVALRCDFSFTFVLFDLSFVLLGNQEQR